VPGRRRGASSPHEHRDADSRRAGDGDGRQDRRHEQAPARRRPEQAECVTNLADELLARRLPLAGLLREGTGEHRPDCGRQSRTPLRHEGRLLVEVGEDRRHLGRSHEGDDAREAFVEQAAEAVHVGARVDRIAADLLRSRVVDGPQQVTVGRAGVGCALHEAEVGQVDVLAAVAVVEEHVRRLHVAMDEPACVRGVERGRHLGGDRDGPFRLERVLAAEEVAQVAVDVPHGEEETALGLARLVDRHHVRVVETGREPRLAQHPLAERLVVREPRRQELERDRPFEPVVVGTVDIAHPAAARELVELVARDRRARRDGRIGCHRSPRRERKSLTYR
jgi:hypothetical protein